MVINQKEEIDISQLLSKTIYMYLVDNNWRNFSKICFQLILLTKYPPKLISMDQFLLTDYILVFLPLRISSIFSVVNQKTDIKMTFITLMLKVKLGKLNKPNTKSVYQKELIIQLQQ